MSRHACGELFIVDIHPQVLNTLSAALPSDAYTKQIIRFFTLSAALSVNLGVCRVRGILTILASSSPSKLWHIIEDFPDQQPPGFLATLHDHIKGLFRYFQGIKLILSMRSDIIFSYVLCLRVDDLYDPALHPIDQLPHP